VAFHTCCVLRMIDSERRRWFELLLCNDACDTRFQVYHSELCLLYVCLWLRIWQERNRFPRGSIFHSIRLEGPIIMLCIYYKGGMVSCRNDSLRVTYKVFGDTHHTIRQKRKLTIQQRASSHATLAMPSYINKRNLSATIITRENQLNCI